MMSNHIPEVFRQLIQLGCLRETDLHRTEDGFWAAGRSVADMLQTRGIETVPGSQGKELICKLFFDDWYLYAVPWGDGFSCSLFKMREQEHDAKYGLEADGDAPGVTVSFVELQPRLLLECLANPDDLQGRSLLSREINRVAAYGGQTHGEGLKAYFVRTQAQGAYLIAELYTNYIGSLAEHGALPVPERYAADYQKQGLGGRVPRFLEENNAAAGRTVCDHKTVFLQEPGSLSLQERLAVLATHTGNVSLHSFAAEVQFHARFLTPWAKVPLPGIGRSPYASAIRADMSIADGEFTGPTPYYRLNSRLVKQQVLSHGEIQFHIEGEKHR